MRPLLLPLFFALLCVAFYAVTVREFQSAARYLLPVMLALALVIGGVLIRTGERADASSWLRIGGAALAVHVVLAIALNQVTIAPVLQGFAGNYWRASRDAATFVSERARPGDVVFAVSDAGMLAYYSRDRDTVADAAGLAVPALVGRRGPEILERSAARFIVEHYGDAETASYGPCARVWHTPFAGAGIVSARSEFSLNVYECGLETDSRP